jgi:molybdate transport system permease protein
MIDYLPLWLSLKLALATTFILLIIGVPLSYWLAYARQRWKVIVEACVSLPMVLPPSVLGFYLLIAFSPGGGFGHFLDHYLDIRLVFTFQGLIVASILYSLPFMVNPLLAGFKNLPPNLREASRTLGKSDLTTLRHVLLPNIRPSLVTGAILCFAHTIGEFGVVMMIGGSIPGQTRLASVAIYDEVQSGHYPLANQYAAILLTFSFVLLLLVYGINHHFSRNKIIA